MPLIGISCPYFVILHACPFFLDAPWSQCQPGFWSLLENCNPVFFLSHQALKNLTSTPKKTKSPDNPTMLHISKACVRYFSLFLKGICISSLFRTKYIEEKFNLQLLFLPTVSRAFIFSRAITRYPPPWNLFRKNNCMCNRDNTRDVAACPDEWSRKRSEPNKQSTNLDKHHERYSNICYTLNSL